MQLKQETTTPYQSGESEKHVEEAITAFEAYLYEAERGQSSTRLEEVVSCIRQAQTIFQASEQNNLAGFCEALIQLVSVVEQTDVQNAADQHGVLLGSLNQLINYLQLGHHTIDDISPLAAVLDDICAVCNKAINIPRQINANTALLNELTIEALYEQGCTFYSLEHLSGVLQAAYKLPEEERLTHFSSFVDEQQQISAQDQTGILDDLLLSIKALLSASEYLGNYSPAVEAVLQGCIKLFAEIVEAGPSLFSSLPKVAAQFRQILTVMTNRGCDTPTAHYIYEKYKLGKLANHSNIYLRLGTPDQQTVTAFFSNVEDELVTLQSAIERLPEASNWAESARELHDFVVSLRYVSVLAGHGDIVKHFQSIGDALQELSSGSNCDYAIIESIASELIIVSERLAYLQRTDAERSNSHALTHLIVKAVEECQLDLEADNLTSLSANGDADKPVAQIELIIERFSHAMQAAEFLSNTQVALVIADSVCSAQSCLLPLIETPQLDVERQMLDSFIGALSFIKQAVTDSDVADASAVKACLSQARDGLRNLQDIYNEAQSTHAATKPAQECVLPEPKVMANENNDRLTEPDEQDALELDEEIVEIFLEEAEEVFELIDARQAEIAQQQWQDNPALIAEQMRDLRRAYHTLKGSGRMAGATHTAEVSWEVESMLNRVLDNTLAINSARMQLLTVSRGEVEKLLSVFAARTLPDISRYEQFVAIVQKFTADDALQEAEQMLQTYVNSAVECVDEQSESTDLETSSRANQYDKENSDEVLPEACVDFNEAQTTDSASVQPDELLESQPEPAEPEVEKTDDLAEDDVELFAVKVEDEHEELLSEPENSSEQLTSVKIAESERENINSNANDDDVLQSIFKDEAREQLAELIAYLEDNTAEHAKTPDVKVERALHTISGGARVTGAQHVAQLILPAEILVGQMRLRGKVAAGHYELLQQAASWMTQYLDSTSNAIESQKTLADKLADQLNQAIEECFETEKRDTEVETASPTALNQVLHNCKVLYQAEAILSRWRIATAPPKDVAKLREELVSLQSVVNDFGVVMDLCNGLQAFYQVFEQSGLYYEAYIFARKAHAELEQMLDAIAIGVTPSSSHIVAELRLLVEEQKQQLEQLNESVGADETDAQEVAIPTVDDEIVVIFLEESNELLEELDLNINRWIAMQGDNSAQAEILRILHTIKGGARMAGLQQVGELCHNFEAFLQDLAQSKKAVDQKVCKRVTAQLSELVTALNNAQSGADITEKSADKEQKDERAAEEYVRVQASTLEQLVGLAGETSISRSLIEERMNGFTYAIDEIESTVERLNEQLRRLEIETEAQINFRKEQVEIEGLEEFDPLEMDRYSHFQQLSRSLIESASDLQALKSTLVEKTRDVETLLLQQGRINTELQEGLMRTRTVPLSRSMVPRLRRTIRQVSGELDKPVNLEIANSEGELDRSVVERMAAPLEHVLRNAIDHGIESADQRLAANKPEVGTITLDLKREGGEVVISLSDDGKGIDVEAVRKKAIANKLIAEDDVLSNEEIMHFIFSRGFSTASTVTQISGRGIGMDVVQTEIRELGGSISLYSEPGKGTTFVFRLPFTVSMNRALLVVAGGETLAVPIDAVEGVVRVSPYELNEYYGEQAVDFMYAGQRYDFSYLGTFINGSKPSYQSEMIGALPVLLVRTGERLAALQVDRLLGSREIVVKSLGRQFTGLQSASGATILGDGSVVMIADLSALVRAPSSGKEDGETARQIQQSDTTVMVVDDSVTVRKVTSRLLKRNNYEVILAKDGLNAMELLEDKLPDIILLDIEMPNLDGFEVVSRVRHDERLKHIPIVMISSRTGEKHRDRALSLGANDFLGKPYQDTTLLEVVEQYTAAEREHIANKGSG